MYKIINNNLQIDLCQTHIGIIYLIICKKKNVCPKIINIENMGIKKNRARTIFVE